MGQYHEPRVPQGAPADGEKDVWLDGGDLKFGHWVAETELWVVDKVISATSNIEYIQENVQNADTLDGYGATDFGMITPWHVVGESGEPAYANSWYAAPQPLMFRARNGCLELAGQALHGGDGTGYIFQLPYYFKPATTFNDHVYTHNGIDESKGYIIYANTGTVNFWGADGSPKCANFGDWIYNPVDVYALCEEP